MGDGTLIAPQPAPPLPVALIPLSDDDPLRTAERPLGATFASVGAARAFARGTASAWGLEPLADDLALVVTELVANALRHGLGLTPPAGSPAGPELRTEITLSLLRTRSHVMCMVDDPSLDVPIRRRPDLGTGSGRGLQLVDSLSTYWGWTELGGEDGLPSGKAVWAVLVLDDTGAVLGR